VILGCAALAQSKPTAYGSGGQDNEKTHSAHATSTFSKSEIEKARRLFEIGMGRLPMVNVRTIIEQLDSASNVMQQIKVEMSRDGKKHQVIIAPMRAQGIALVDDGLTSKTYFPDDKTIIIQPSARQLPDDSSLRLGLFRQNYTLKVDRREKVAGRTAFVVMAVPKNDELETRCYAIDEKTGFVLRMETCRNNGSQVLHFETKMVEFPSTFSEATFQLDDSTPGVTIERRMEHRCVPPSASGRLQGELGFLPVVPNDLPYGFEVQELQTTSTSKLPALSVRVTDGLAKATVFQWRRQAGLGKNAPAPPGTVVGYSDSGRMTFMISGDLPHEVKQKILEAFLHGGKTERSLLVPQEALSWVLELQTEANAFSLNGDLG
jgi:hypothetical protein